MSSSNSLVPKYGEEGAQMRDYPQRYQAPLALQRAMEDDRKCMEMCPSPGLHLDKLGDQADPLSPERKRKYKKKKARIPAARMAATRSKKGQVNGRRKRVAKKPSQVENATLTPERPPPLLTIFPTAGHQQNALDSACYFKFYATLQTGHATATHIRSPASMPSLESDRGTPSTAQSSPSHPPVAEREGKASADEEDVDSEDLFNTVYQSFFIPRSSWSHPPPALE